MSVVPHAFAYVKHTQARIYAKLTLVSMDAAQNRQNRALISSSRKLQIYKNLNVATSSHDDTLKIIYHCSDSLDYVPIGGALWNPPRVQKDLGGSPMMLVGPERRRSPVGSEIKHRFSENLYRGQSLRIALSPT